MMALRIHARLSWTTRCVVPAVLLAVAVGCAAQGGKPAAKQPAPPPKPKTLQQRLADFQRASVPPAQAKVYDEDVAQLGASGIASRALNVGAQAPDFTLADVTGEGVTLRELLKDGPVVLLWFRGGWSPYCTIELRAYSDVWPQFQELGATLVAISPQNPEHSLMMQQLGQFEFPVLSDVGNKVARAYGLVYKLLPEMRAEILMHIRLQEYNSDESLELPLPATYVIDRSGVIRYAFVDPDYRRRAEPSAVLAAIKELQSAAESAEPTGGS